MRIPANRIAGAAALPAVSMLLLLAACSGDEPSSPAGGTAVDRTVTSTGAGAAALGGHDLGMFPLAVGNSWDYAGTFHSILIETGKPAVSAVIYREEHHEVIGTETRPEGEYRLVEDLIQEYGPAGNNTTYWWERLRQTRTGLFALDVSLNEPPADEPSATALPSVRRDMAWEQLSAGLSASEREAYHRAWMSLMEKRRVFTGVIAAARFGREGAREDEITRLAYPLHPRQTWVMRDAPHFAASVVGNAPITLAFGRTHVWRIRIDIEGASPSDWAEVWYGPLGFVGQRYHAVTTAIDEYGQPIGTMYVDDALTLTDTNVNRPRGIQ